MAKKKDNTVLYIALGAGALYLISQQSNSNNHQNCNKFRISPTQSVCEHDLPSYGYVNYQGRWIHYSVINQQTGQQGNQNNWQDILNGVVTAAPSIIETLQDLFGNDENPLPGTNCAPWLGITEGC